MCKEFFSFLKTHFNVSRFLLTNYNFLHHLGILAFFATVNFSSHSHLCFTKFTCTHIYKLQIITTDTDRKIISTLCLCKVNKYGQDI